MVSLKTIILSFISIAAFHIIATIFHWYWLIRWLDIPMHFIGGVFVTLVFYWLFERIFPHHFNIHHSFWTTLLFVLGWVALIGVLLELMEFSLDVCFIHKSLSVMQQQGLRDTMGDLCMDLLGGMILAFFMKIWYNKKSKIKEEKHYAEEETISLHNHSGIQ
ncbi:MAG: hypothetical protein V1652_01395 [bacterium]